MLVNNWYNEQSHFEVICLYQCPGTAGVPACRLEQNPDLKSSVLINGH
jgi:hypothetical protein